MVASAKIKEESSRAISTLLLSVLEASRQGDVDLAAALGLDISAIRNLDKLKADQIVNLSQSYLRGASPWDIFNIDSDKMSKIIESAARETRVYELIDEYLIHGACKKMMMELFGLRSTQVANRKKFLNVPSVRGRLSVITVEEERSIYDAWVDTIEEVDFREHLLLVAKKTQLSLSKIYRVVNEIERIEQENKDKKVVA